MPAATVNQNNAKNVAFKDKEKPVQVRETNITAAKGMFLEKINRGSRMIIAITLPKPSLLLAMRLLSMK